MKYYLMGVFASAVMLYGMSLIFGVTGQHAPRRHRRGASTALGDSTPFITLGIVFVVIGFAFKVSAVPFHTWAPDTYEGAPTPDHRVPGGARRRRPASWPCSQLDLHRASAARDRRRSSR